MKSVGEAKRRKTLDPNYGKGFGNAKESSIKVSLVKDEEVLPISLRNVCEELQSKASSGVNYYLCHVKEGLHSAIGVVKLYARPSRPSDRDSFTGRPIKDDFHITTQVIFPNDGVPEEQRSWVKKISRPAKGKKVAPINAPVDAWAKRFIKDVDIVITN